MTSISRFEFPDDKYYEEETAFIFHDPDNRSSLQKPLPRPPPLPKIPSGLIPTWQWKEDRHLSVDFEAYDVIPEADAIFFSHMIQRDDIVLTAEGVFARTKNPDDLLNQMESTMGDRVHEKFRRFDRDEELGWKEADESYAMLVKDFVRLCRRTNQVRDSLLKDENAVVDREFTYAHPETGEEMKIDVVTTTMYLTDLELKEELPMVEDEFKQGFKLKGILPGGELDLMQAQLGSLRPFMGPNGYVTPPGGFTLLHQDGFGTVNSGHCSYWGVNEVIILRRLPLVHKQNAVSKMGGDYDGVFEVPHSSTQKRRPEWPTVKTMDEWKRMNYVPIAFVLKPGSIVLLGTGRLHCFRKMTPEPLPETDAHHLLRKEYLELHPLSRANTTFQSIAYDWMFSGVTPNGINREVATMMESVLYCRQMNKLALASIQGSIWAHASRLAAAIEAEHTLSAREKDLCRGLLPTFQFLVKLEYPEVPDERAIASSRFRENQKAVNNISPVLEAVYCDKCQFELGNVFFEGYKKIKKTKSGTETVIPRSCLFCFQGDERKRARQFRYRVAGPSTAHFILNTLVKEVGEETVHFANETLLRLRVAVTRFDEGKREERLSLVKQAYDGWKCRSHPSAEELNAIPSFPGVSSSPASLPSDGTVPEPCKVDSATKRQRVDPLPTPLTTVQPHGTSSSSMFPSPLFTPWQGAAMAPSHSIVPVNGLTLPSQVSYNFNFFPLPSFVTPAGVTAMTQLTGPPFAVQSHIPAAQLPLTLPPRLTSKRECRRCGLNVNDHPADQDDPSGKKCRETRCVACRQPYEAHLNRFREKERREPDCPAEGGLPFVIGHHCVFLQQMPPARKRMEALDRAST